MTSPDTVKDDKPPESRDPRRAHLSALGSALLAVPPLRVRAVQSTRAGPVSLHVLNPDASNLAEDIGCVSDKRGGWWFTWSWGDRIGPASDTNGAARAIGYVLGASGRERRQTQPGSQQAPGQDLRMPQ